MNLVAYSDSDDSDETEAVPEPKKLKTPKEDAPKAPAFKLPSASGLFSSVKAPSFMDKKVIEKIPTKKEPKKQAKATKKAVTNTSFAPPQLKKANVATEDTSAWNTDKTTKKQTKVDKNKTFKKKEKRKRDIGQSSRGKSWVEEEKRILRESGF